MKDLTSNSFCNSLRYARPGSGYSKGLGDVVMVAAFVFFFGLAAGFAADSTTFRGDARHTGVYDAAGVPQFNGVKWVFKTEGQIIASPAVHGETVYVGSTGGTLYAIDRATGSSKWQYLVKSRIASSPAVEGGLIYFGAFDGNFYAAIETTGQLKWKFQTGGEHRFSAAHLHGSVPENETMPDPWDCYLSSPVVWKGAVYFGSGDGNVYALDAATGALKWKFKTGNVVHASPAIANGVVFVGSWDSYLYALDAVTGTEKWRFQTGVDPVNHNQQGIQSSAAIFDGVVYFGCRDGHLYAVDEQTGVMKWAYNTKGSWVLNSPAVSHGKVYFATSDTGLLYAADAKTGSIAFSVNWGWPMFSSPAIAGDMLYIGSTAGTVNAARLADGTKAWSFATEASKKNAAEIPSYFAPFTTNFYDDVMGAYDKLLRLGPILSSPVVVDNVIYVGSVDGNLYALD
jgi:outer membrane protein assembly factor BamB